MPAAEGSGAPRGPPLATIRRVLDSDLAACRALRLAALSTDPLAFGSTLERERNFDESTWVDRVHRGATSPNESTWVAEGPDGRLVGMIGVFPKEEKFHVVAMWVAPDHRGRGVGGQLLDGLLRWIVTSDPRATVLLSVNPSQLPAVRLYLSRGFRPTGIVEPLGHTPGVVLHEMVWNRDLYDPSHRV
jgi:ribosomal protein S18 acetylase RimI-like enzyme